MTAATACPQCNSDLTPSARFCAACGRPVSSISVISEMPTIALPAAAPPTPAGFAAGTLLNDRYRIIKSLGRGGMGEVYSADDLKLGSAVALKFLPRTFAQNPRLLSRFHSEVRNARQVSHPNVCRVHDIGEYDGQQFLTMELIDGEDLASLLRRIGRIPTDKALEITRQICAGLAAAHGRGVLHRDLKPANIMLDGTGQARITDFGLAVTSEEAAVPSGPAGTPAYMAPELIHGRSATIQSDLYALGLVLYEIFTGKRAQEENPPRPLRSHAPEIDPVIDRAVMRCLEKNPSHRPRTAFQLAAALPGGDPLAAALAAGETPSPDCCAASAQNEVVISVRTALTLMIAVFALLGLLVPLARRGAVHGLAPMARSPIALADRAQDIAKELGYAEPAADSAWFLDTDAEYLRYRADRESSAQWFGDLITAVPDAHRFHYRQSPQPLTPFDSGGTVTDADPPHATPGMVSLVLDGDGHVVLFKAVATDGDAQAQAPASKTDWNALFTTANWDVMEFSAVKPAKIPEVPFDERAAWDARGMHIEAASFRGKPVYFEVVGPWNDASAPVGGPLLVFLVAGVTLLMFGLPLVALSLARRNLKFGRADATGAFRLAAFVTVTSLVYAALYTHYAMSTRLIDAAMTNLGLCLFFGSSVWVSYMALEPPVRKYSPELMISWTRLLAGEWRDARVGRDMLIGVTVGLLYVIFDVAPRALASWVDVPGLAPLSGFPVLGNARGVFTLVAEALFVSVYYTMTLLFLATLSKLLFRNRVAPFLCVMLVCTVAGIMEDAVLASIAPALLGALILTFTLLRFGPLAFYFTLLTYQLLATAPTDLYFEAWYFSREIIVMAIPLVLALYGFRSALGGRPLVANILEES